MIKGLEDVLAERHTGARASSFKSLWAGSRTSFRSLQSQGCYQQAEPQERKKAKSRRSLAKGERRICHADHAVRLGEAQHIENQSGVPLSSCEPIYIHILYNPARI